MKYILRVLAIIVAIVGIVVSTNLITRSNNLELPKKFVYVSGSSSAYDYDWGLNAGVKYVGGDAYNLIIEASLKAGYYNAVATEKITAEVGGYLLLFISIFVMLLSACSLEKCIDSGKQLDAIKQIVDNTKVRDNPSQLPSKADELFDELFFEDSDKED
jgi:hypothetical protein